MQLRPRDVESDALVVGVGAAAALWRRPAGEQQKLERRRGAHGFYAPPQRGEGVGALVQVAGWQPREECLGLGAVQRGAEVHVRVSHVLELQHLLEPATRVGEQLVGREQGRGGSSWWGGSREGAGAVGGAGAGNGREQLVGKKNWCEKLVCRGGY